MPTIKRLSSTVTPTGRRPLPQVQAPQSGFAQSGAALAGAGEDMQRLAEAEETTEANLRLAEFEGEQKRLQFEAQQAATGGAAGLANREIERFDTEAHDLVESLPPRLQDQGRLQIQRIRNGLDLSNRIFEENARAKYQVDNLNGILEVHRDILAVDPGGLEASADFVENAINQSQLREDVKADMLNQAFKALFETASTGLLANPRGFRKALEDGRFDRFTQGNQKAKAIADTDREIKRLDREAAARAKAEARSLYEAELASLTLTGQSTGVEAGLFERVIGGETGRRMSVLIAEMQRTGEIRQELAMAPFEEVPDIMARVTAPEGEDFDIEADAAQVAAKALLARNDSLAKDSAQHVMQNSPAVQEAFLTAGQATDPEERTRLTEAAVAQSWELQTTIKGTDLGNRVMTIPMAEAIVRDALNRPANERGAFVNETLRSYGRFAPQALGELKRAKLPGGLAIAGELFHSGQFTLADTMARAVELPRAEHKKLVGTDSKTGGAALEQDVRDAASRHTEALNATGRSAETIMRVEAAIRLAWQLELEGGSDPVGTAVAATFPFRVGVASDAPLSFRLSGAEFDRLLIPNDVNQVDAEFTLTQAVLDLRPEDIDFAETGIINNQDERLSVEQQKRFYVDSVQGNHSWRTSREGAQLLDADGRPVPLVGDRFLVVKWTDIRTAPPPPRQTAPEVPIADELRRLRELTQ